MDFNQCLAFVLQWEGGYVNDPRDPGGATNKGITQRTYDMWCLRWGLRKQDVRQILDADVQAIYEADYWLAAHCGTLASPLNLVVFDTAVNMGVGRAVKFLQFVAGVPQDGEIGPLSRHAIDSLDPVTAARAYCDRRDAYYRQLVQTNLNLGAFLKGWMNRLNALRAKLT